MSIAEINRTLIIKSPQEFYKILVDMEYSKNELTPFMDNMSLFINGCPCDSLKNWEISIEEYSKINTFNVDEIKNYMKCSSIKFYLDEHFLFEL